MITGASRVWAWTTTSSICATLGPASVPSRTSGGAWPTNVSLPSSTNLHKNRGQAATQLCPALGVQRLTKASLSPSRNGAVSLTLPGWLSSTGSGIGCKCGGRPAASSASLAREHPPPSPHLNNMPGVLEKQDVIITGDSTDTLVVSEEGHGGQCLQGCDDEVYRESRCLFQLSH